MTPDARSMPPAGNARQLPVEEVIATLKRLGIVVGDSPGMLRLVRQVARAARAKGDILMRGERGTGKSRLARALHDLSLRKDGPYEVAHCAALPENLVEDGLFGHEKGAFTDAKESRPGAFERATGGTIYLPDITEMRQAVQPKLLGVLEDRVVRRLGGTSEIAIDVRVIADTNRDIFALAREDKFRADLCDRLDVIYLHVLPLREHLSDVQKLVGYFIARYRAANATDVEGISPAALAELMEYDFPGNVRELKNIIIFSMAMEPSRVISVDTVRQKLRRLDAVEKEGSRRLPTEDEELEALTMKRYEMFGHNVPKTAASLDKDPKTIQKRIARHEAKQPSARV